MKQPLSTTSAPAAIGPYSQAIVTGDFLFCSGQIPVDPATGKKIEGSVADETRRVLDNIRALLAAHDLDFRHVIKCTIFMTHLSDFAVMNSIYAEYFPEPYPARSTVQVSALPLHSRIEIEVIARCDSYK